MWVPGCMDEICVMQPLDEADVNVSVAEGAYAANGEANMTVVTLRDKLLGESSINEDGTLSWNGADFIVFTDSNESITFSLESLDSNTNKIYLGIKAPVGNGSGSYMTNIALRKTVSVSSSESGRAASSGNDGNSSSLWIAADGNAGNWWMVDLGGRYDLNSIRLAFENGNFAWRYKIQASVNNVDWITAADVTNNIFESQIQTFPVSSITAQYILETSAYDLHGDHAYISIYVTDILRAMVTEDPWDERISVPVPEDMLTDKNLKNTCLATYASQYSSHIGSFAKADESLNAFCMQPSLPDVLRL